jgi:tetratricopeptide (TPR) repeat protein
MSALYEVSTNGLPEAVAHFDSAVDHMLHFRSDLVKELALALEADPFMVMGHVFEGYLGVLATEPDDARAAKDVFDTWLSAADSSKMSERESRHIAAANAWLEGDMLGAGVILADLTRVYPRDLLALAVGHQIDFFSGNAVSLRDRVGGALSAWSPDDAEYSLLLGMLAFGLEESGLYERGQESAEAALDGDDRDVWAVHAAVHCYEMKGEFPSGLEFLDRRAPEWTTGNFFNVHNWWHYCLFALEAGRVDLVLRIYDAVINNEDSSGLAIEMLDASSLLWRLYLKGDDQSERWSVLAGRWKPKMKTPHYAFNDMHAVMSYVAVGELSTAEDLIKEREQYVANAQASESNRMFTSVVGLPVCKALVAFGKERYDEVVEELFPIRGKVQLFGGSHAQRDAVQRTLLEGAIRSGNSNLARSLASERLCVNPNSPYNWLQQARILEQVGQSAEEARKTAAGLERGARSDFEIITF